jgi:polyhydroxyalkanoate synthesis regulator phasin
VQEISHVQLTEEEAQEIVECVNDNDMSYELGRSLVESVMEQYYPDDALDKSDEDEGDCNVPEQHNCCESK